MFANTETEHSHVRSTPTRLLDPERAIRDKTAEIIRKLLGTFEQGPSSDLPAGFRTQKEAEYTYITAWSFGRAADGSPGPSNVSIAKQIRDRILPSVKRGWDPRLLLQDEIYDALWQFAQRELPLRRCLRKAVVAGPPRFSAADFPDLDGVVTLLVQGRFKGDEAMGVLRRHIPRSALAILVDQACDAERKRDALVDAFNGFLRENSLHWEVYGLVTLADLDRGFGKEYRSMPDPRGGLTPFQQIRFVGLMLEGLFAKQYLARRQYLGSKAVAQKYIEAMRTRGDGKDISIEVYAHPDHTYRCRTLLVNSASEMGYPIKSGSVRYGDCRAVGYDGNSAQDWTRSSEVYRAYELKARLAQIHLPIV